MKKSGLLKDKLLMRALIRAETFDYVKLSVFINLRP